MAQQQVGSFFLTAEQVAQLSNNGTTGITIEINYYDAEETLPGYEVLAKGEVSNDSGTESNDVIDTEETVDFAANVDFNQILLCGRPCNTLIFPTQP